MGQQSWRDDGSIRPQGEGGVWRMDDIDEAALGSELADISRTIDDIMKKVESFESETHREAQEDDT
jgi:hypothetical protein